MLHRTFWSALQCSCCLHKEVLSMSVCSFWVLLTAWTMRMPKASLFKHHWYTCTKQCVLYLLWVNHGLKLLPCKYNVIVIICKQVSPYIQNDHVPFRKKKYERQLSEITLKFNDRNVPQPVKDGYPMYSTVMGIW